MHREAVIACDGVESVPCHRCFGALLSRLEFLRPTRRVGVDRHSTSTLPATHSTPELSRTRSRSSRHTSPISAFPFLSFLSPTVSVSLHSLPLLLPVRHFPFSRISCIGQHPTGPHLPQPPPANSPSLPITLLSHPLHPAHTHLSIPALTTVRRSADRFILCVSGFIRAAFSVCERTPLPRQSYDIT